MVTRYLTQTLTSEVRGIGPATVDGLAEMFDVTDSTPHHDKAFLDTILYLISRYGESLHRPEFAAEAQMIMDSFHVERTEHLDCKLSPGMFVRAVRAFSRADKLYPGYLSQLAANTGSFPEEP